MFDGGRSLAIPVGFVPSKHESGSPAADSQLIWPYYKQKKLFLLF